jgi:hypothetical protein
MNEHARKVTAPRSDAEAELVDQVLGGILLERHKCRACGTSASRVREPK